MTIESSFGNNSMLRPGTFALTALFAGLTAIGPLTTDMYLPSLPSIARLLGASTAEAQLTISSYLIGFAVGFLAQRSRFCTMGAFRDLILFRQNHLFQGLVSLVVFAFLTNLIVGQFHPGFAKQPVAHTMSLWNFGGMVLAGLAFALAGGCPGRQLFLAGEGDGDAAVFVLGMIVGAGFAHNFGTASSPAGVGPNGIAAVIMGLLVCLFIGFTMRRKAA